MRFAAGAIFTALLSLVFTGMVRATAQRLGIVAAPRRDRWHRRPTALLGGIAIYLAFIVGTLVFLPDQLHLKRLLMAGTCLFVIGLIDDLVQVKPYVKLAAQLVAASALIFSGQVLPWTGILAIQYLVTFFWLVGLTNAVNMLDNMDGLAGGISLIACVFLAVNFGLNGQTGEMMIPLVMAAALAGFLFFNFNPASIFMGDCGSMFVGFTIAGMALLSDAQRARNLVAVLATPVLIMMIPIFDTTIVTISRKLNGRPVSQGGRDHTSHRLVALGMSDRKAVLWLYLISIVSGGLALMVRGAGIQISLAVVAGFVLTIVFLGFYLGKVKVYEAEAAPAGAWVSVLTGHPYRRRIFEVMLDFSMVILVYYMSYLLRFDGQVPPDQRPIFMRTLPLVIGIHLFLFLALGIYRGIWQYAGVEDLVDIGKGAILGSALSGIAILTWYGFHGPSRSVFIINAALLTLTMGSSRVSFRLLAALIVGRRPPAPDSRPVLIYGAGDGGELLVKELVKNPVYRYEPVAFIDDDREKSGKLLRGYRIFESSLLPKLAAEHGVSEVLISSGKVPESRLDAFRDLGIQFRRLRIHLE